MRGRVFKPGRGAANAGRPALISDALKISGSTRRLSPTFTNAKAMKQTYCAFNNTRESFLGLNISRGDTWLVRLSGLSGKLRFRSGEGVWLNPARGIHTIGMLSPIDLAYLDASYRVIYVVEHLSPFRIAPIRMKSSSVLELPAHTIYASQTRVGDQLLICEPREMEDYLQNSKQALNLPVTAGREGTR
jgi:uncharacterized protein